MRKIQSLTAISLLALLVGCTQAPAPVTSIPATPSAPQTYISYVVEEGDTLSGIASQYQMSYIALARLNNIAPPYMIHIGQVLQVPNPALIADKVASQQQQYGGATKPIKMESAIPAKSINFSQYQGPAPSTTTASKPTPAVTATTTTVPKTVVAQPQAAVSGRTVNVTKQATVEQVTWSWPVAGQVVQEFGQGSGLFAKGVQIQTAPNAQILAAADGTVIFAGTGADGYGKMIIIKSANNFLTAYTDLNSFLVKQGQVVQRGTSIAVVGTLNNSPMLHFEVRKFGTPVDPEQYMPE